MINETKSKKFTGVYIRTLEDKSKTYYIVYKDPITKKTQRLKIGNSKDGFNETYSNNKRNEIVSKLRLGDDPNIPILKAKSQKLTLNDIAKLYFNHKKLNETSRSTQGRENKYYKHFSKSFGLIPLQMITKNDILNLQKELIKTGLANSTINNTIQIGSTIFKYSLDNELYNGANPFSKIKGLKNKNIRITYLTNENINLLKENVKSDKILLLFVVLSLTTGGRLETILNIQKKHIDINSKNIALYDFKNKSHYNVALTNEAKNLLENYFKHIKEDDFIINYDNGLKTDIKKIQRRLSPILNRLFNQGLEKKDIVNRVVIHSLRHTFASHLAINGTAIFTIQKLMNHKDIKQTMRYAKLSPETGINEVLRVFDN